MTKAQQLLHLLEQIPQQMQAVGLWQEQIPEPQAMLSQEPFAVDTLQPEEWLQWIFLEKMHILIKQEMSLPRGCSITPYFEECWKERLEYTPLLTLLVSIDEVCA